MARNRENAPSEPSGGRRRTPEGASALRQQFRDSIRDALSGVDVDELQGRSTLPVPSDVSLLTRETVSDLEAELAALRAERAELERKAQERTAGATAAVAVVEEAPAAEPPPAAGRWSWRRGRLESVEIPDEEAEAAPAVPWSLAKAMEPVAERPRGEARPSAPVAEPELPTAPDLEAESPQPRTEPQPLTDSELEQVVAPLLAELANLRSEVRQLRGDPDAAPSLRPASNRQLVRLIAGVFVGFALIVIALAVVLKA